MELKVLLLGINLKRHLDIDAVVKNILRDFDTSGESRISMDKFVIHLPKWLDETKPSAIRDNHHSLQNVYLTHYHPKPIRFKHKLHPVCFSPFSPS